MKKARTAAWSLATFIVILSVVPPSLRPETGVPHSLEHFAIYWATGVAFGFGYERRQRLLAVSLVAFSGAMELIQLFVPGRHARLSDFIVDALATCAGLLTVSAIERFRGRARSNKLPDPPVPNIPKP